MAGICSRHHDSNPACRACQITDPAEVFPDWERKHAEALAAGLEDCKCGFQFYRTIPFCPLCGRPWEGKA